MTDSAESLLRETVLNLPFRCEDLIHRIQAHLASRPEGAFHPKIMAYVSTPEQGCTTRIIGVRVEQDEFNYIWEGIDWLKAALRSAQPATVAMEPVKVCDGKEQDAFEAWATGERYDIQTHPLHWLFLNEKTYAARNGWKAAIEYCASQLTAPPTRRPEGQPHTHIVESKSMFDRIKAQGGRPIMREDVPPEQIAAQASGNVKPDTDRQVFFYEQDFYVLSNFSAFNLELDGMTFPTSEHAYHWLKFNGPTEAQTVRRAAIMIAESAHAAFKIAERHKADRLSNWDEIKADTMRRLLRAKTDQHEYVRRKLLQTGDRELIEDSWRDDYWGWGPNRDGQNMLGKLWMEIRAELRVIITEAKHD